MIINELLISKILEELQKVIANHAINAMNEIEDDDILHAQFRIPMNLTANLYDHYSMLLYDLFTVARKKDITYQDILTIINNNVDLLMRSTMSRENEMIKNLKELQEHIKQELQ